MPYGTSKQPGDGREECLVELRAARKLIGIRDLGEALAWAYDLTEAADELWVDEQVLRTCLDHLHPAELHYLRRRLEIGGDRHSPVVGAGG